jgi:hypothetical protein
VDIVAFVGKPVELRRSGKMFVGRCPWHASKSGTSFHVDPIGRTWRCWGCNVGGDAIAFVERFFGVNFRGAIEILACEVGVDLSAPISAAVIANQRHQAELAACKATVAKDSRELLLKIRHELHSANRLRINAGDRLIDLQNGARERFAGEEETAREALALATRHAVRLNAGYILLSAGLTVDVEQFVADAEARDALVDAALRRGYVRDNRGRLTEIIL